MVRGCRYGTAALRFTHVVTHREFGFAMAVRDFTSQRVFVEASLAAARAVVCSEDQAHYLRSVLRMEAGREVLVFNGRDGEWRAQLRPEGKRGAVLDILCLERPQATGPDLWYLFAPIKRARLDYMVQKAVELGVSRLMPILTQHTNAERFNIDRARANVIEAAEQCGVLNVPEVAEPVKLTAALATWPRERALIFCDEAAAPANPLTTLAQVPPGPLAVLIGPEGGFSDTERQMIAAQTVAHPVSLGPRIMRADTAAIAALAVVQAVLGDWR